MMKWKTSLGFALFELLIWLILIALLMSAAIPSMLQMSHALQMKRAANELKGFMMQSRSEAIARNQDLWAHITDLGSEQQAGLWRITLTDSEVVDRGETILLIDGRTFASIKLSWNYTSDRIRFYGVRGRVENGSLEIYVEGESDHKLRLKSSFFANRVVVCAEGAEHFGYAAC